MTVPDNARRQPPGPLLRLARLNPTGVFLVALAVVLVGLLVPGLVGGAVLLALAVAMMAVLRYTWPVTDPRLRVIRVILLGLLLVVAIAKIV